MKNLLIYVNPNGFDNESEKLVKIQIDNSLELGWSPDDIVLITDFPYDYAGITAHQIPQGCYYELDKEASKFVVIDYLFDNNLIENDLYWCHDLDAYQLHPITEQELALENVDLGLNDYCRAPRWQLGSFFFKPSARDIFKAILTNFSPRLSESGETVDDGTPLDEVALMHLTDNNIGNINSRIKRLNTRYDFGMRRIDYCWTRADKPLKVLHFHPQSKLLNTLAIAMYGKNATGQPLMTKRLIKLFNKYGYS